MTKRIVLAAILAAALAIRIVTAVTCEAAPDFSDMAIYNEAALAEGVPAYPPPGYPLFLRLIYSVAGASNFTAVFVVQAILSALTVFLIYYTARRVAGEIAGLSAAAIAAVYPNFIAYNLTTLTETVSLLLLMLILAAAVSPIEARKRAIIAGVILVAGYFVKPSILFFFPGMFIGMKKRFFLAGTIVALLLPLFVYGSFTGKGEGRGPRLLYKAYNPKAVGTASYSVKDTELGAQAEPGAYIRATADFVRSNKWLTLDIIYYKASLLISKGWDSFVLMDISRKNRHITNILIYGYLPVMLLGLIGMIRFSDPKNRIIWLMAVSYVIIHVLVTIFKLRYRLLVEPMLIVFSGIVLEKCLRKCGNDGESMEITGNHK